MLRELMIFGEVVICMALAVALAGDAVSAARAWIWRKSGGSARNRQNTDEKSKKSHNV